MRYSILMPYHNRAGHLHNTLVSFVHHYSDRKDYEVIVIEDAKTARDPEEHRNLLTVLEAFNARIRIHYSKMSEIGWNPAPLFNEAAAMAREDIFILTSPECFHLVDVLKGLDEEFSRDPTVYVVCGCESVKDCNFWIERFADLRYTHHRWYQHSEHRNARYHFCSAISRVNYGRIGGFDNRFGQGYGYEDNDFRDRVDEAGIRTVVRDDLHTLHLWHEKPHPPNYKPYLERNRRLYESKRKNRC